MNKHLILTCAGLWACLIVLPLALVSKAEQPPVSLPPESDFSLSDSSPSPSLTPVPTPVSSGKSDREVMLTVNVDGVIMSMNLSDYLLGVLCAEIPALYPEEALKAQAVAARTYYAYKMAGGSKYDGADMSSDSSVCMAYKSPAVMVGSWGEEADAYTQRLRDAIAACDGVIMTDSAGKPIPAMFFAISSGKTESAETIWGSANTHLVSRDSSWDTAAPGYREDFSVKNTEFVKKFSAAYPSAVFPPDEVWFSDWKRSDAGTVISVKVGGVTVTGRQMRTLLGLRSANFTVSFSDGVYTFTTLGYGHGVGLSQYGAKALANMGKGYRDILCAYYSDFSFTKMQ